VRALSNALTRAAASCLSADGTRGWARPRWRDSGQVSQLRNASPRHRAGVFGLHQSTLAFCRFWSSTRVQHGVDNMREVLATRNTRDVGATRSTSSTKCTCCRTSVHSMLKRWRAPAHVKFILATTDPQKIPVTVLSAAAIQPETMPPALWRSICRSAGRRKRPRRGGGVDAAVARGGGQHARRAFADDQAIAYGGRD